MSKIALSGKDTTKINDRILNDLVDGDCVVLTYPNDLMQVKSGKNGNSIYSFNYTGEQCEVVIRVLKGSSDDKFLNELLATMKNDPPAFVTMGGEFIKNIGDGEGTVIQDTYVLSGGVFKRNVDSKENSEGDTEQSVSIYSLAFSNAPRVIG